MNFDYMQAIRDRHSVRSYLADPIPEAMAAVINEEIARCSAVNIYSLTYSFSPS